MVVIRLSRGGNRHRPFFVLVATDSRSRRDGRFIEKLGFYAPKNKNFPMQFTVNQERLAHWTSVGAQLSDTVAALIKQQKNA